MIACRKAAWLLGLVAWVWPVVATESLRVAELDALMPLPGDYTYLYWANGWNRGAPREPALICLQTGTFGAVFDPWRADLLHLGALPGSAGYAEAVGVDTTKTLLSLPSAHLELAVDAGGSSYRCARAATNRTDWLNFPVRIIESGRFLQRWDLLQLTFTNGQGIILPATGRLEVIGWPDRLHLVCELTPAIDLGETALTLSLTSSAPGLSRTNQGRGSGRASVALLADLDIPFAAGTVGGSAPLRVSDLNATDALPLAIERDARRGWWRVRLPEKRWSVAQEPDRLERYRVDFENPSDLPDCVGVVFDAADGTPGITGVTAMWRDLAGNPTGIPVQLSKNWHRQNERRLLYEGPWGHAITRVRLPPRSRVPLELAFCWARWGGVPAASHAQLCLIGWGWNQLWDQAAIGSWGESICYEPDAVQQRCRIDDIRPLMVWGMNGEKQKWTWTHNVGGGDFLVYYDERNEYQPWRGVRTAYLSQGPNLTDVRYAGVTADGAIACQVRVSTPRTDDLNRAYHHVRYDVRTRTRFQRLAFYQLGSDNYHWHQYQRLARGNTTGLIEEWTPERGGKRYSRTAIACEGDAPWFSLHAALAEDNRKPIQGAWATRGLVIRSWRARLGGKQAPACAAVFGTEAGGIPSANLELVPSPGITELVPGDYVDAELELLILPHSAGDYYGPNANLRQSLIGTADTWRPVFRQALGNRLELRISRGRLQQAYPIVIEVDRTQTAEFEVTGGCGYVPVTLEGLRQHDGYRLDLAGGGTFKPETESMSGTDFWQAGWDPKSRRWRRTYNLCLDRPRDLPVPTRFKFHRLSSEP